MNVAYNQDCIEAMLAMPDGAYDLAVVDPPYGIKVSNNMGRRKGDRRSDYKKVTWDNEPPPPEYFLQLRRVSKNQIIFGANHFITRIPSADSPCWICWDKGFSDEVSFASFELAWTSFNSPCKRVAMSSAQAGWTPTWGAGQAGSQHMTPAWTSQGMKSIRTISQRRNSGSMNTQPK